MRRWREHMELDGLPDRRGRRDRRSADQPRLVPGRLRPLRRESRTFGITTLRKRHVTVRGSRITFSLPRQAQHPDPQRDRRPRARRGDEGADRAPGRRAALPVRAEGGSCNLDQRRLNDYIRDPSGRGVHRQGLPDVGRHVDRRGRARRARRRPRPRRRRSAGRGGRCARSARDSATRRPSRARSYVSPAVVEQYLDGRTIEDFRPRNLRVVGARDTDLDREELALLSLLRSWRIRAARAAA